MMKAVGDDEYVKGVRDMQRGLLIEAANSIVGIEYSEDDLAPIAAVLVVYGPNATLAIWDADLQNEVDLRPAQTNGMLAAALGVVATVLVNKDTQSIEEEEEESDG